MFLLELFCGTKSVGKIAKELNMEVISLDYERKWEPTLCCDIMDFNYKQLKAPDIIWASPDCSTYSMAAGYTHWNADHTPKSAKGERALLILLRLKEIISHFMRENPKLIYFIENPRARMRWFMNDYPRYTISYCSYGFNRMKPTDIWTNVKGFEPKMCKNGDKCHIASPRGSKTGTQGASLGEKYSIPPDLIKNLFSLL